VLNGTSSVSLAADREGPIDRWLVTPVSRLELESLAMGYLPMRDLFSRKQTLLVLDMGPMPKTWTVEPEHIPYGILPARGALLPTSSRTLIQRWLKLKEPKLAARRVRFAGTAVHDSLIEFAALGRLVQAVQDLWSSLGETLGIKGHNSPGGLPSTALLASAFSPGSFALDVQAANPDVFDQVLQRYRQLVLLAYEDVDALKVELSSQPDLQTRFRNYLRAIEELGVEAAIEARGIGAYIGHAGARSIHASLKVTKPTVRKTRPLPSTNSRRGHFLDFGGASKKFRFRDIDTDEQIEGRIATGLANEIVRRGAAEAAVGTLTRYVATFEVLSDEVVLVAFEEAPPEPGTQFGLFRDVPRKRHRR
jgi:hypothetical protein